MDPVRVVDGPSDKWELVLALFHHESLLSFTLEDGTVVDVEVRGFLNNRSTPVPSLDGYTESSGMDHWLIEGHEEGYDDDPDKPEPVVYVAYNLESRQGVLRIVEHDWSHWRDSAPDSSGSLWIAWYDRLWGSQDWRHQTAKRAS